MEKLVNFIAYCVVVVIAFPVTTIELIFKVALFIALSLIFLIMMFLAPLFRNLVWPKSVDKFISYVFSMNFAVTCKVIDAYKKALGL